LVRALSAASCRRFDSFLDIIRSLTRPELNNAKVREAPLNERILADDRFDLLSILADREDDAPIPRNLPSRDDKIAGSVVLLQEDHVRLHRCIDFSKRGFVDQFDDKHDLA
jgi:hypothetical protein